MKYYAIIGKNTRLIIGGCTNPIDAESGATFVEITKQEYNWIGQEKTGLIRLQRMLIANMILRKISEHGRRFFLYDDGRVSQFEIINGRLWYRDGHRGGLVYVSYPHKWRRFSEGGTLRSLVENLRDFINHRAPIKNHFGPWPDWICGGDLWGYGKEAMDAVREALKYPLALASRVYKMKKAATNEAV